MLCSTHDSAIWMLLSLCAPRMAPLLYGFCCHCVCNPWTTPRPTRPMSLFAQPMAPPPAASSTLKCHPREHALSYNPPSVWPGLVPTTLTVRLTTSCLPSSHIPRSCDYIVQQHVPSTPISCRHPCDNTVGYTVQHHVPSTRFKAMRLCT